MGDQQRFAADGPRELNDSDRCTDGKPRVVSNPESARITAAAQFDPLIDPEHQERLIQKLDERAGTQRGKPRSQDPSRNPLGGLVYDPDCGWPLYRQPFGKSFRYLCGFYQQSHAVMCRHNSVDGPLATRFVLGCVRQRLLHAEIRKKLEKKLRKIAERECAKPSLNNALIASQAALTELRRKLKQVAENMALAKGLDQFGAVSTIFDDLKKQESLLVAEVQRIEDAKVSAVSLDAEVAHALAGLDQIAELAETSPDFATIGVLIRALNVRLFLWFKEVAWNNRIVNRIAGGFVAFGSTPAPVKLYSGPIGRRQLRSQATAFAAACPNSIEAPGKSNSLLSSEERDSLGNVNRGDTRFLSEALRGPKEPAGQRIGIADRLRVASLRQEGGLKGILGRVSIVEPAAAHAQHHRTVPLDQGAERILVLTFNVGPQQRRVGRGGGHQMANVTEDALGRGHSRLSPMRALYQVRAGSRTKCAQIEHGRSLVPTVLGRGEAGCKKPPAPVRVI